MGCVSRGQILALNLYLSIKYKKGIDDTKYIHTVRLLGAALLISVMHYFINPHDVKTTIVVGS